jgi:type I restriction enzyme S subunit
MIRTTNFEQNNFQDFKYITEDAYNFLSKSKVYEGNILMNKIANAGSVYYMPKLNKPVSLAMNLFLIRIDNSLAKSKYVYLYLKQNEKYIKSFAAGSVTKTITKEAVRNLEIELQVGKCRTRL